MSRWKPLAVVFIDYVIQVASGEPVNNEKEKTTAKIAIFQEMV